MGSDVIQRNHQYQPVLLKQLPMFENGAVIQNAVTVKESDSVVDWSGEVLELGQVW